MQSWTRGDATSAFFVVVQEQEAWLQVSKEYLQMWGDYANYLCA